jgi:hypothetical protein
MDAAHTILWRSHHWSPNDLVELLGALLHAQRLLRRQELVLSERAQIT